MFFDMYIYSEIVFNTLYIEIKQILKKFPSDKINGTKNTLFFLSRVPTHDSFTLNLRFLYDLKQRFVSLKLYVGFSIFGAVSFLLKFIFLFNKMHGLFDFKTL